LPLVVVMPETSQRRNRAFACRRSGKTNMLKQHGQEQPDTPVATL